MKTPVYIVTGFLNTGKTHFINRIISSRQDYLPTIIQFEAGKEASSTKTLVFNNISRNDVPAIAHEIQEYQLHHYTEELWIEWNGMQPFTLLEELFNETTLSQNCEIKKVFFITTPEFCLSMLPYVGEIPYNQLYNADQIILQDSLSENFVEKTKKYKEAKKFLYQLTKKKVSTLEEVIQKPKKLTKNDPPSLSLFLILLLMLTFIYVGLSEIWPHFEQSSLNKAFTVFTGVVLQALPFLTLGIIASSAIQLFVSPQTLEKNLSQGKIKGHLYALLGGFLFPVCDCATIPIFRTLVSRQVPVSVALLFMLSSPLVNPIVIFSTYFAFNGDIIMTLGRTIIGVILALLISLSFFNYQGLQKHFQASPQVSSCLCNVKNPFPTNSKKGKLFHFIAHTQSEFFQMTPYLLFGTLISVIFQVYLLSFVKSWNIAENIALSIAIMMGISFLLSLCSTSDSMIARVFGAYFPAPAVLAFLLLGPILDLKNLLLMKSLLPNQFVLRLFITTIILCFSAAILFAIVAGGINVQI